MKSAGARSTGLDRPQVRVSVQLRHLYRRDPKGVGDSMHGRQARHSALLLLFSRTGASANACGRDHQLRQCRCTVQKEETSHCLGPVMGVGGSFSWGYVGVSGWNFESGDAWRGRTSRKRAALGGAPLGGGGRRRRGVGPQRG